MSDSECPHHQPFSFMLLRTEKSIGVVAEILPQPSPPLIKGREYEPPPLEGGVGGVNQPKPKSSQ